MSSCFLVCERVVFWLTVDSGVGRLGFSGKFVRVFLGIGLICWCGVSG